MRQIVFAIFMAGVSSTIWAACTAKERAELAKGGYQKAEIETFCAPIEAPVQAPPISSAPLSLDAGVTFRDCTDCPVMVVIPAGGFVMGSRDGSDAEQPIHPVSLKAFALAQTKVTQGQWRAVMGRIPSYFKACGSDCPVENVSWDDAQEYIKKLNVRTGKQYRLPSEAEWEYACRAGGEHTYCGGNDIDALAWHKDNSHDKPHVVAGKQANAWGLYDMSGNVWEWAEDCWNDSYNGAPSDGSAWVNGYCSARVLRGGSWNDPPWGARATYRYYLGPAFRDDSNGFRPARMLP